MIILSALVMKSAASWTLVLKKKKEFRETLRQDGEINSRRRGRKVLQVVARAASMENFS